jgi:uncharacterized membrane protein
MFHIQKFYGRKTWPRGKKNHLSMIFALVLKIKQSILDSVLIGVKRQSILDSVLIGIKRQSILDSVLIGAI